MWLTALVVGLAGSLHCAGMCSPLALAVATVKPSVTATKLLYNAGRIFTYGLLGATVAAAGALLPIGSYQNIFSIVLGTVLLVVAFAGPGTVRIPWIMPALQKITGLLKRTFSAHLRKKSPVSVITLGALNGLLPCGLTVIALGYCITLKGPLDGFNFMLLFGIGTMPAMLGLTALLLVLVKKFSLNMARLSTLLMAASGILLIARVLLMASHEAREQGRSFVEILCR